MNQYLNCGNMSGNPKGIRSKSTNLIVAFDGCDDGRTKPGGDADTESTDHTADEEIPDHVLFSPSFGVQPSQGMRGVVKCSKSLT